MCQRLGPSLGQFVVVAAGELGETLRVVVIPRAQLGGWRDRLAPLVELRFLLVMPRGQIRSTSTRFPSPGPGRRRRGAPAPCVCSLLLLYVAGWRLRDRSGGQFVCIGANRIHLLLSPFMRCADQRVPGLTARQSSWWISAARTSRVVAGRSRSASEIATAGTICPSPDTDW